MKQSPAHMTYHWWKYLLVLAASTLVWMVVFDSLGQPAKNEKIRISYFGEQLALETMEKDFIQILPSLTHQTIEKVTVENPIGTITADYHAVLTSRIYGADFIIIEESVLAETVGNTYFLPLPVDALEDRLLELTFYTENDVPFGILLNGLDTVFSSYYSGDEKCYLFITHTSVNMAGIMGTGSAEDDAALKLIEYLLENNND